jgi:hypothetical protein
MSIRRLLLALALERYQRSREQRRWRALREQPFKTVEEALALSWLTSLYARYGTDEQLAAVITRWQFGVWPRQLPRDL